jgi:hypothetical protein
MMFIINNVAMNSKIFTSMLYDSTTWFESHWSYNTFTKQLQKKSKVKKNWNAYSKFRISFPIVFRNRTWRNQGSGQHGNPPSCMYKWIPLCKSLSQKVSSWAMRQLQSMNPTLSANEEFPH